MDLTDLTAAAAADLIARREISAVELTRACLERIAARDPAVGAFCHVDPAFALAEAARADGLPVRSSLHGVPFGVKDVIDTADLPTECGTVIHRGRRPHADALCVTRMRAAGAVLLGKLVTTEYALYTPNGTRHPQNPAHTPGGSSSGTAAAVADRMVPIAFGNQTAGSLIRPAAFCGVYGLKPTHGTVDCSGILPLQPRFDTLGYMARSIEDLQRFYGVVSAQNQTDAWPHRRRPTIGVCKTFQWEFAEPATRFMLFEAAERFAARGCEVEEVELPAAYAGLVALHRRVLYAGIARSLADDFARATDDMSESLRAIIAEGRAVDAAAYDDACREAERFRQQANDCFGRFDAFLCPSAPGEAPTGTATGNPVFQVSWTLLGVPCLNLPVGTGPHGLPVGVQLVGRRHDDACVLALGRHLMQDFAAITTPQGGHA
jgi:Asp-tRNA(Asn)/Glu-tRNA(Gln) amidotransferase A subunit family amidase